MLLLDLSWPSILTIFDPASMSRPLYTIPRNYYLRLFRELWSSWNSSWISLEGQNLIATETRLLKWSNDSLVELDSSTWINIVISDSNQAKYCEPSSILLHKHKTQHLASKNHAILLWRSLHTGWWFRRELLHFYRLSRQHPEFSHKLSSVGKTRLMRLMLSSRTSSACLISEHLWYIVLLYWTRDP